MGFGCRFIAVLTIHVRFNSFPTGSFAFGCQGTLVPVSHDLYYHGPRNGVYAYFTYGVEPYRQGGWIVLGGKPAFLPVVLLSIMPQGPPNCLEVPKLRRMTGVSRPTTTLRVGGERSFFTSVHTSS